LRAAGSGPRDCAEGADPAYRGARPCHAGTALALASARAGDTGALERVRFKFPTAAIAVLEFPGIWQGLGPEQARLTAFVVPRELRTGSGGG